MSGSSNVRIKSKEVQLVLKICVVNLVIRRGVITIVLITAAAMISGLSVPLLVAPITGLNTSDIPEPGVEIVQTVFAPLLSDETDPAIITGNWSGSGWTGTYHLNLPNPTMSDEEGRIKALSFIEDDLRVFLDEDSENPKTNSMNEWRYVFFNGTLLENGIYDYEAHIIVTINSMTGRVIGYYEVLSEEFIALLYSGRSYSPVTNETEAQEVARDYILARNYTLPYNAYLLDTRMEMFPYESAPGEPENYTRPVYIIELGIARNNALPDKMHQGLLFQIDAVTGRMLRFEYFALQLPEISMTGLVSISTARAVAQEHVLNDHNERAVYLRLLRSISFQLDYELAWAFAYELDLSSYPFVQLNITSGVYVEELHINARSGTDFYPPPYFSGGVSLSSNPFVGIVLVVFVSAIVGAAGHSVTMKRIRRES